MPPPAWLPKRQHIKQTRRPVKSSHRTSVLASSDGTSARRARRREG